MSQVEPTPVVPLEAGAGPENPPCPAGGEPLFGWVGAKPGLAGPVRRCESCGLGVVGDPAGAEEALRELDRLREDDAIVAVLEEAGKLRLLEEVRAVDRPAERTYEPV